MLPAAAAKLTADENLRALDGLRFLWLELTNRCNLTRAHCYAESGPRPSRKDALTAADYKRLLEEAAALGCRAVRSADFPASASRSGVSRRARSASAAAQ